MANTTADRSGRGANPRLKTSTTLVAIPGIADGGTARLLNLSTAGACVEFESSVEEGQSFELKLAHPRLSVVPVLTGEVKWVSPATDKKTRAGLQFVDSSEANRVVRPFLTAEAGHCLFQEDQLVGFLVPHGKALKTWSLFEASGKRLAVAARTATGFEVHAKTGRAGSLPSFSAASLFEAACTSIGVGDPLRLDPAVIGWRRAVAPTPKAVVAPAAEAKPDAKADAKAEAKADAKAEAKPEAKPEAPAAEPAEAAKADAATVPEPVCKDATGSPVQGPAGPLGFLCETEMPNAWLVVDKAGKQVAYLAGVGESSEYQICSMGDAIDDELEFRVFPDLKTTVAAAFGLGDSSEGVQIGASATVGRITPALIKDEESSVELDVHHRATQITLTGYPTPKAKPKATEAKAKVTEKTQQDPATRRLKVAGTLVAISAIGSYLAYAGWLLISAYSS